MSCISLILKSLHRINNEISCWIFALKERTDHTRFARGTSQTFQALEGLVDKGVKVDIGIPKELWHKPSAEVSHLKTQVGFNVVQQDFHIVQMIMHQLLSARHC